MERNLSIPRLSPCFDDYPTLLRSILYFLSAFIMSAIESNQNDGEEDKTVGLSVQGQYFIVKTSMIESHDWILSKILSSDIPWERTSDNGQIYLDVETRLLSNYP